MEQKQTYTEQYIRTENWLNRLKKEKQKPNAIAGDFIDFLYAFYQNCYHIKDWLLNDPTCALTNKEIYDFINKSETLKICHDLANGTKHLTLKKPKSDKDTRIDSFDIIEKNKNYFAQFTVVSGEKIYDAFQLANICFIEWKKFLRDNKLI